VNELGSLEHGQNTTTPGSTVSGAPDSAQANVEQPVEVQQEASHWSSHCFEFNADALSGGWMHAAGGANLDARQPQGATESVSEHSPEVPLIPSGRQTNVPAESPLEDAPPQVSAETSSEVLDSKTLIQEQQTAVSAESILNPGHAVAVSSSETECSEPVTDGCAAENAESGERHRLPFSVPQKRRWRPVVGWSLIAGSAGWIAGLAFAHQAPQTLPWCIALSAAAAFTLKWLYQKKGRSSPLYLFKLGERRPLVISEGLAISFFGFSLAVGTFLMIDHLIPHPVRMVTRQVVDIEFVSNADAVNRHDILPGTIKKADEQKKVSSNAVITAQGRTLTQPAGSTLQKDTAKSNNNAQASSKAAKQVEPPSEAKAIAQKRVETPQQHKSEKQTAQVGSRATPSQEKLIAHVQPTAVQPEFFLHAPQTNTSPVQNNQLANPTKPVTAFKQATAPTWVTKNISPMQTKAATRTRGFTALEEVAPPEMVELTDSEGETRATELYQSGGRSTGGTGAKSTLAAYLKELHHRIKRAWAPPAGETRTAEILFRIKRTGKLVSIKLTQSSGNPESDDAAMVAVAGCSPFKTLPSDYPADYLDLLYTFNYTVDRLAEVAKPEIE
jgi:outer membrane biosynthesis protein TonB